MKIDIIQYTDAQFAALSAGRLQKVSAAQVKKNKLLRKLEEDLKAERQRLIDRGMALSSIWEKRKEELTAACNAEIEEVRQALLFYLRYAVGGEAEETPTDVPYPVDYSLTMEERMEGVRSYYTTTYTAAQERFEAFAADTFARSYLGELYAPLYQYFEELARA